MQLPLPNQAHRRNKMFLQAIKNFLSYPTRSRTLSILAFLAILLAIPLTVFIAQQQQEIRQRAEEESCPDLCFADQLWINIHPENGSCINTNAKEVYTCKTGEQNTQNTITCGGQPFYCNGSDWTSGVRPQAPTAAPTNPPASEPTAAPTATPTQTQTGPAAQLQTCTPPGEFGFCGNSQRQFPQGQQVSCGTGALVRISSGDSACTNRQYPLCYVCPNPTQAPSAPTATPVDQLRLRSANPTPTPTSAPRGNQPTATPTGTRITGDINGSGSVDTIDYSILISCFGANANLPSCQGNKAKADLNNDGKVDGIDYNILIRNFGK